MKRCKKILIVALNYYPELVGCAKYTSELAEELVRRGYSVEVVCSPPYYPNWAIATGYSGRRWVVERHGGVKIYRTPIYVPKRPNGAKRLLHLMSFGVAAVPAALWSAVKFKPDVVLNVAPTLPSTMAAKMAAIAAGARSWLHVQDFEVDAAFELGLLRSRVARSAALILERFVMRRFDGVSSISTAMTALLDRKGVSDRRIFEFRNWVDVGQVANLPSTYTSYRATLGIGRDDIVALYSGNMAAKQGIENLAEVAKRLERAALPVVLIACGDGPAKATLERECAGLKNVRFIPLQPLEKLSELLGTADIHLLPQRGEAADLVLPSKLTGMLASGRPVVAMAMPGTGLAAEVEGAGLSVPPTPEAMAEAIALLVQDRDLRLNLGRGARERAEKFWKKQNVIDGLEKNIETIVCRDRFA